MNSLLSVLLYPNITKAKLVLFYLSVFYLPINLFLGSRPAWAYLDGILIDYWMPSLYASSLLIASLLVVSLVKLYQKRSAHSNSRPSVRSIFRLFLSIRHQLAIVPTIIVGLIGQSLLSDRPVVSLVFLAESLIGPGLLLIYLLNDRDFVRTHLSQALCLSLIFQSFLALYQYIFQSNFAPYWLFGEPAYRAASFLATSDWSAAVRWLPYGSTPHPNILGGWMVLGVLACISTNFSRLVKAGLAGIFCLVLISTESLTAMVSLIIVLIWYSNRMVIMAKFSSIRGYFVSIALPIVATSLATIAWNLPILHATSGTTSISRRAELIRSVLSNWTDWVMRGNGLLQHIALTKTANLPTFQGRFLQPVHSLLVILTTDFGIGVILLLGAFLYFVQYSYSATLLISIGVLPMFSLDHYGITTISGQFLLILLPLFLSNYFD